MSRYLGLETEYGIATPGHEEVSPIITSTHAVVAYAAAHTEHRPRWDYAEESPLKDTRGYDLKRYHNVPVVDANAVGVASMMLPNGARFYVDHAHPEYSTPECSNAWQAMVYDAAGNLVVDKARSIIDELYAQGVSTLKGHPACPPLKLYKNNVDGKGASYGSHENYLYSRSTNFDTLAAALIPFFVARIVVIGAGRMGIGERGEESGFQISQRADYFMQEISLETTLNRGIINTRDEPHAAFDHFRRLHVIVGDANMSQTSNLLKVGMTSLVIDAIENGVDFSDLALVDPVSELKNFSRDLSLTRKARLKDDRELTALEILAEYRSRVEGRTDVDKQVLELWDEATGLLAEEPLSAAHLLDWVAKWKLISTYIDRGIPVNSPKLQLIDLQYTDIDPAKGLYYALLRAGRMRALATPEEIARAAKTPPEETRAWFRGILASEFASHVVASSWQNVIVEGRDGHVRIDMPTVDALNKTAVGALVDDASGDIDALLDALAVYVETEETHIPVQVTPL
ncbi:depupylase/deamidase Dop [Corynebacterium renale]|uniref:Proteasome accessory factor A n=1 Tax=Corynebacterium renale TaxID=1724 RepID=A0A2A9DQ56_9CORY|nr:depupylase/deamidase Dop [Corynebacterium renale]PFG28724.1 proteasome accessory factor A [Corynebacterium renale]SQI26029.1 proteasome accessory factor [Corynebacterium renale]